MRTHFNIIIPLLFVLFLPFSGFTASTTKYAADSSKGFHWPYYLYLPNTIRSEHILVVPVNSPEPNNDFSYHENKALEYLNMHKGWADTLGTPFIVPIFPRFDDEHDGTVAPQGLGRGILDTTVTSYYRIDLQLIGMIEDVRSRQLAAGKACDGRIYIWGGSQAGWFANRFSLLHPERVRAAAFGHVGWIMVPTTEHDTHALPYPYGMGDVEALTGFEFDAFLFSQVPIYVMSGELDDTGWGMPWFIGNFDDTYWFDVWFDAEFGTSQPELHAAAKTIYENFGSTAEFHLYEGIGHYMDYQMGQDILNFFINAQVVEIGPDLNGDGSLDLTDVIIGLQILSGTQVGSLPAPVPDINSDQQLGLAEIIYLIKNASGVYPLRP